MSHLQAELVEQYVELSPLNKAEEDLINIAGGAAGVCFKAENTYEANKKRLLGCIERGHTSVLEHAAITVTFRTDRATATALVRHRHCAFTQESTIYTKYTRFDSLSFIRFPDYDWVTGKKYNNEYNDELLKYCQKACDEYTQLLDWGYPAGIARDVLPNCTATILTVTTSFREIQQILKIRKQKSDSVRMHQLMAKFEVELRNHYPELLAAITKEE